MGGSELFSLHIPFVYPVTVRNPLKSSFVGDHFGGCFVKIDQLIPKLRMRKDLHRKKINAIQTCGNNFFRIFLWQLWHRVVLSLKLISARI